MANYVGRCLGCSEPVDRDDRSVLYILGDDGSGRVAEVACSWACLERGAAGCARFEKAQKERENA